MSTKQISQYINEEFVVFKKVLSLAVLKELFENDYRPSFATISKNLIQAFIHKSFKHENTIDLDHNETLEFLGDSVLQLIISEKLFTTFPHKNEGDYSKIRSAIVNENSLASLAQMINMSDYILLGRGELQENGHTKKSILANTFEAVLGAIYLDSGLAGAQAFLENCFNLYAKKTGTSIFESSMVDKFDAKTKLQELVMKKYKSTPSYAWNEVKDGSTKLYEVKLIINAKDIQQTVHVSKKKAMQILAKQALDENNF